MEFRASSCTETEFLKTCLLPNRTPRACTHVRCAILTIAAPILPVADYMVRYGTTENKLVRLLVDLVQHALGLPDAADRAARRIERQQKPLASSPCSSFLPPALYSKKETELTEVDLTSHCKALDTLPPDPPKNRAFSKLAL